jgi:hypothetical protein
MSDQFREVFIDFLPNQPKNEQTLESSRQMLGQQFEQRLPSAVELIWDRQRLTTSFSLRLGICLLTGTSTHA